MKFRNQNLLGASTLIKAYFLLATGALILIVLHSPATYLSDEAWYLNQIGYVERYGFGSSLLAHWHGSAGPLFSVVHFLAQPLTRLSPVGTRLLSVCLIFLIILVQQLTLPKGSTAMYWLAIPFIWKIAGIAYTETPSLLFASISLFLLRHTLTTQPPYGTTVYPLLAGLSMGFATWGRQPFVAVALISGGIAVWQFIQKKRAISLIFSLYTMGALALPCWTFLIWGGLQPKILQNSPLDPLHAFTFGLISLGYIGLVTFFLNPNMLFFKARGLQITCLVLGLASGWLGLHCGVIPLATWHAQIPPRLQPLLHFGMLATLTTCGVVFCAAILRQFYRNRHDAWTIFLVISTLALGGSHILIGPVFSSRYLLTSLPFLVLLLQPDFSGRYVVCRFVAGCALGALSLWGSLGKPQGAPFWDSRMEIFYPHLWKQRPEVFTPKQWDKFDYGNSSFIQNPRWGSPVRRPTDTTTWQWPGEPD